jgi:hypothetical protein
MRDFLISSLKHAVNAILVNSGLMLAWSDVFHIKSWAGVEHLLATTGIVILSRLASDWLPKILTWSTTGVPTK